MLTQQRLKELIHYDPVSGVFTWLNRRCGPATPGNRAGTIKGSKYRVIYIDRRRYPASHLAWLYVTGELPNTLIDHHNRDKFDDRWDNLRAATRSQNVANTGPRANNACGIKGVSWDRKRKRWRAQIRHGKLMKVTVHRTKKAAAMSYENMAHELYGEFANKEARR